LRLSCDYVSQTERISWEDNVLEYAAFEDEHFRRNVEIRQAK